MDDLRKRIRRKCARSQGESPQIDHGTAVESLTVSLDGGRGRKNVGKHGIFQILDHSILQKAVPRELTTILSHSSQNLRCCRRADSEARELETLKDDSDLQVVHPRTSLTSNESPRYVCQSQPWSQ